MTGETLLVFALLLVTVVLFVSDKLRLDVVAILVILALMLTGILNPREALAGFGDPVVVLIAGLFVVGEGLFRTGIAYALGNWLMKVGGGGETRLLVMLMLVVAVLSAFMSSTGAVAIFIPVALNLAARSGIVPSRLMMPMAFAALIGGMLTLIGTPPNLVVSTQLTREGMTPFNFFSFTPIGLLVLAVGIIYMVLIGRRLLGGKTTPTKGVKDRLSLLDLTEAYEVSHQIHRLRVEAKSMLPGRTVAQGRLRSRYGVTVLGFERKEHGKVHIMPALNHTEFRMDDIVYMIGDKEQISELAGKEHLRELELEDTHVRLVARELGMAEVLLTPRSALLGRTLSEARFRERRGLTVMGILRMGEPVKGNLIETRLAFGDSLLVGGGWKQIELLQGEEKDFMVLNLPREMDEVAPYRDKAYWALGILAAMLVLMTFKVVPSVTAVLIAALAMVLAGCVTMKDAYSAINWQSLVLIAGMLPMATALEQTGGIELIVNGLVASLGEMGPLALMAGLFVLTSVFSQFISNTATTVLVAPIAIGAAVGIGVSPYSFLMTVAIAASTAFATPVASPVNTLVLGPGGYRFNDFVKVGVPLQLLALAVTLLSVPLLFPLR